MSKITTKPQASSISKRLNCACFFYRLLICNATIVVHRITPKGNTEYFIHFPYRLSSCHFRFPFLCSSFRFDQKAILDSINGSRQISLNPFLFLIRQHIKSFRFIEFYHAKKNTLQKMLSPSFWDLILYIAGIIVPIQQHSGLSRIFTSALGAFDTFAIPKHMNFIVALARYVLLVDQSMPPKHSSCLKFWAQIAKTSANASAFWESFSSTTRLSSLMWNSSCSMCFLRLGVVSLIWLGISQRIYGKKANTTWPALLSSLHINNVAMGGFWSPYVTIWHGEREGLTPQRDPFRISVGACFFHIGSRTLAQSV